MNNFHRKLSMNSPRKLSKELTIDTPIINPIKIPIDDEPCTNSSELLKTFIDTIENGLSDTVYVKTKFTHPNINLITFYWNDRTIILDVLILENECSLVGSGIVRRYIYDDVNIINVTHNIIKDIKKIL